ncbi:MAG: hypothetical protein M2R45_03237 [Verrucomicrobia subdivision 3 bacterium]|nr:hypothetical protein [Limisphaerales bacterium]MCS1416098.1 hypothetical protein [Limisphaerales bacterium]
MLGCLNIGHLLLGAAPRNRDSQSARRDPVTPDPAVLGGMCVLRLANGAVGVVLAALSIEGLNRTVLAHISSIQSTQLNPTVLLIPAPWEFR